MGAIQRCKPLIVERERRRVVDTETPSAQHIGPANRKHVMSTFYPLPKLCPNCNEHADECDLSCFDEDREYTKRRRQQQADRRTQWWTKIRQLISRNQPPENSDE